MTTFHGTVLKGNMQGTVLGFPTANIELDDPKISGIFAGYVDVGEKRYQAAVYADQKRKLLEAHLLDFSGELYGKTITVELLKKLREDARFPNEEALREAIRKDLIEVREYFAGL